MSVPVKIKGGITNDNNNAEQDMFEYLECPYSHIQMKPLYQCLIEKNRDQLKHCSQFYSDMAPLVDYKYSHIMNANINIIVQALKNIGFRTHPVDGKIVMENIQEWKNNLPAELSEIVEKNNAYILTYIDFMSQWVNAHPEVLNKNPASMTEQEIAQLQQQIKLAKEMKMKGESFNKTNIYDYLEKVKALDNPVQSGGHHHQYAKMVMSSTLSGERLGQVFHHVYDDLQRRGKVLDERTLQKIKDHIDNITKMEQALVNYIHFISESVKSTDLLNAYNPQTINDEQVEEALKKYNELDSKILDKQEYILKIFQQIENKI